MLPKAKKSFSQNFLRDNTIIENIIEAADLSVGDHVLEIGPGRGALTRALVDAGARVTAVEADQELVPFLTQAFGKTIHLVSQDILSYTPEDKPYRVVANLPYSITSAVLKKFLTIPNKPLSMVVMVQREVADRMCAKAGDMSLLSVVCQLYARVSKVVNVPNTAFIPVPKVHSAVVKLELYPDPDKETEAIIALAKIGFSSRRKQLQKNLANGLGVDSTKIKNVLAECGLAQRVRAQELTVDEWKTLHAMIRLF